MSEEKKPVKKSWRHADDATPAERRLDNVVDTVFPILIVACLIALALGYR